MDEERHYGLIFPKAVSFIWGLILVHSWVECALVALFITHLAHILDLPKAASLVNLLDGTTAVMMLIVPYLSETHLGPFPTIICTTTAYIFGLLLFHHGAETTQLWYAAVILVGVGRAGCNMVLKEFLSDQFRADEERVVESTRAKIWWSFYILGILASVFLFTNAEWKELCLILIIAMAVAFILFLLGFSFYERKKPASTTLTDIVRVLYTAITNRHPFEYERVSNIQILRWLYRGAVEESSPGGVTECTVEQVDEVKSLPTMLPLCSIFIFYGLMLATANIFFYEQTEYTANYLSPISAFSYQQSDISCNDPTLLHISNEVPPIIFVIIRYSVSFAVSWLCNFLSRLHRGNNILGRVLLIRSGVGLAVSSVCCLVAWRVEEHRVEQRLSHGVCIRFSWLIPQFVLLGISEGLVPQTLGRYVLAFKGIGHLVSWFSVFIFRNLFKDDLNYSRLGVYYKIISCVCGVKFLIYCCLAPYYAKQESSDDGGGGGDEVMEQPLEQMHEQGHESVGVVGGGDIC